MVTKAQKKLAEQERAKDALREILNPGDKVFTVLRHVSASGMSRRIDAYKLKDGDRVYLSGWIAQAGIFTMGEKQGLKVEGCGMDMGFHLVYNLGATLWPKGFTLASSQHGRNGDSSRFDRDGGYALGQEWL